MNLIAKIILLIASIVIVDMVLLNLFHLEEYIITAISIGIAILAALYEARGKD